MLLTHALLHAGTIHVLMNAVIFIALGKTLAVYFGLRLVMLTMLLGAVSSGVAFGLLESTAAPMVGASGVVFAFIGLWLQASRTELKRLGRPGAFSSVSDDELNRDSCATACIHGWANRLASPLGGICCRLLLNALAD
jgi:membrane associated rhomboid family serine protease